MRVVLDLPDWVDERNIRIFAGIELVAHKMHNEEVWKVKDERCNMCGLCCMKFREGRFHYFPVVDGCCIHLKPDGPDRNICDIALHRPFPCGGDPKDMIEKGTCVITYKEQSGK